MVPRHITRWLTCLICGKNRLLQNQDGFEAESWYIASGIQDLLSFQNDGRMLTFEKKHF